MLCSGIKNKSHHCIMVMPTMEIFCSASAAPPLRVKGFPASTPSSSDTAGTTAAACSLIK